MCKPSKLFTFANCMPTKSVLKITVSNKPIQLISIAIKRVHSIFTLLKNRTNNSVIIK